MYKLIKNSDVIFRIHDQSWIPLDPRNSDYQAYLAWVAEGNEPLPADQPDQGE